MVNLDATEFERRALELAWRACKAGTIGIGALLVSGDGVVLYEGNNAIFAPADAGPLSNSRIAHAEMNVLAQVTPADDIADATLYTSLEPCSMCAGAIVIHDLHHVRVLAKDWLMHDLDAMGDRNDWIRRRWTPRSFATDPGVVRLAGLLASHTMLFWSDGNHSYVDALIEADPETAAWMLEIVDSGQLIELASADASLDDVIEALLS